MFNVDNWWFWGSLVLIVIAISAIERRNGKELPSPKKEFHALRYSLILFCIVAVFFFLGSPFFYYYSYIPPEFKTLDDAYAIVKDQNAALSKLNDQLDQIKVSFGLLLLIFGTWVLPSIYGFAKAIALQNEPVHKDLISIFDENQNS